MDGEGTAMIKRISLQGLKLP